ncbi:hypothetical protein [Nevskia ramosa]|uniref:hypothetical protein n=1 Tax=Nevskia ramosa TaxID=64002 RepID=UPI0023521367|nr:hypothetical protein [Nevskia ramosa]
MSIAEKQATRQRLIIEQDFEYDEYQRSFDPGTESGLLPEQIASQSAYYRPDGTPISEEDYYNAFDRDIPYNANADGSPAIPLNSSTAGTARANREVAALNRSQAPPTAESLLGSAIGYARDGTQVTVGGEIVVPSRSTPPVASPSKRPQPFVDPRPVANSYDELLGSYELGADNLVEENNEVARNGGPLTQLLVDAVAIPRDVGLGLIDTGLRLGGIFASPRIRYDALQNIQTAYDSFTETVGFRQFSDLGQTDLRFSVSEKFSSGQQGKLFIGTDRAGVQYKLAGGIGKADNLSGSSVRESIVYTDGPKIVTDAVVERDFGQFDLFKYRGMSVQFSPGIRINDVVGAARVSANFSAGFSYGGAELKIGIELRLPPIKIPDGRP